MTDMTSPSTYKPALLPAVLKKIAAVTKKILPQQVYRTVYDTGFSLYKNSLRVSYFRHALYASVVGDTERWIRATSVFRVMPFSLVGTSGLDATYAAVLDIEQRGLSGSVVECGVAQGGCAALMSLVIARSGYRRHIWLFDSYEGLPDPTTADFVGGKTGTHLQELRKGSCLGTIEQVQELLFDHFRLSPQHISLVKGWFEHTIEPHRHQIGQITVLRIDADWYESVKCCLTNLFDQVVSGGYIIIDDYYTCFGARKATDEFLDQHQIQVQLTSDGRGGVLFRKP